MAVLILIIIIDILLVVAVMYWGSKENVSQHESHAADSAAVASLNAKVKKAEESHAEQTQTEAASEA